MTVFCLSKQSSHLEELLLGWLTQIPSQRSEAQSRKSHYEFYSNIPQPTGTVWSRSPHAATEEPTVPADTLWKGACTGPGRLGELPPVGTHVGLCLKGGPQGMELCWDSAGSAAAHGKSMGISLEWIAL